MKRFFAIGIISLLIAGGVVFVNTSVLADTCTPLYGGGVTCPNITIAVNKTVQHPQTGAFVDNLGLNDTKFSAEQTVTFQLVVTNTGNASIPQITVRDTFPQFTNFIAGPGTFNNDTKVLTFEVTSLAVGESRTFTVQGKVVGENQLPADVGIACPVNQVAVTANTGQMASDTSQFCIARRVLGGVPPSKGAQVFPPTPVTQIPAAGVELVTLFALLPTGLAGFMLRKRSSLR